MVNAINACATATISYNNTDCKFQSFPQHFVKQLVKKLDTFYAS